MPVRTGSTRVLTLSTFAFTLMFAVWLMFGVLGIPIQKEFGSFDTYLYSFMPNQKRIVDKRKALKDIPASSPESDAISKDLKKRGFKFFGTTICYAHMQATGMVNDHLVDCYESNS